MFMFHEDQSMIPSHYREGWRGKMAPSAGEVATIITKYVASNCLWANGVRLKENFRCAEWLGLDVDDGMTLEEGKKIFEPYLHVIGTTKSHQIQKSGKVRDRYRVFLKFGQTCRDKDDYEETARQWSRKYKTDTACVDAARFFFPCKEIVVCKYYGKIVHAVDAKEITRKRREAIERKNRRLATHYRESKALPGWANSMLRHGCDYNKRDITIYKLAKDAKKVGYSEQEIFDIIVGSSIPSCGDKKFSESKCRSTIRSAFK